MKRILFTLTLLCLTLICKAQRSDNPDVNKGLDKVITLTKAGKTEKAEKLLNKLAAEYQNDFAIKNKMAIHHLNQENYTEAIPILNEMTNENPNSVKTWYTLYDSHKKLGSFDEAKSALDMAIKTQDKGSVYYQQLIKERGNINFIAEAMSNPVEFEPRRLGDAVNTKANEYLPSMTLDGMMLFTRKVNGQEDLYYTYVDTLGQLETALPLLTLNTPGNEGAHFISIDGNLLFLSKEENRKGFGSFDLYYSFQRNGEWSPLKSLGKTINSSARDRQPCLSPDGKTLYFTSNRKGGFGGDDIYKSELNSNNQWSTPVALDSTINTTGNEASPFMHPDGKTLYFRSDGKIGMGGFDIYYAKASGDSWSDVTNLGYPINTEADEGALFVDIHGQKAYYASDVDSDNLDIFEFDLPYDLRPEPVTFTQVKVIDANTEQPLLAAVNIVNLDDGKCLSLMTTEQSGSVSQILDTGNSYAVTVSKSNYTFYSANINLEEEASAEKPYLYVVRLFPVVETEELSEVEESMPIVLNNIFFESGKSELLPKSATEIQNLLTLLSDNPEIGIKLIGHTDDIGQEQDNLNLSEQRAKAVYTALLDQGAAASRIAYEGRGESEPIADNTTSEGRAVNRRTEFIIVR